MDYEKEYTQEILCLSADSIRSLSAVWKRTFDQQFCENNFRRLKSHAKAFYNDLLKESLQKESYVKDEINGLRSEAENLIRLLKTEVDLPDVNVEDTDIPLLVIQQQMDKSLCDLREQLRHRNEQIYELLLEQETLCEELGEPPRALLADPLPTSSEINDFREYLSSLKLIREERIQSLHALRREIKSYLQILDLKVNTDNDDRLLNQRQIQLSKETFDGLTKLRKRFADQVAELHARIDDMREKLNSLWERLNTPIEIREQFQSHTKYDQYTADVLYQELQRCEDLKRQNIKQYIKNIRVEIENWWNLMLKSEVERKRFIHFYSHNYSDELLTMHELELNELKRHYENYKQIYELYVDRRVLWERMEALEQKANDPARYNNRGGQLLREERERKTIANKLPKIEQQIKDLVQVYQEREHLPFLVYGEDILQVIESDWQKKREEKEALSNARKHAITPQAATNRSHISSATRTPLLQRNASASILRKTPSNTNLSNLKHANLGSVGGSAVKRKLHASEKTTPNAKRSLWKSPQNDFKKPTASATKRSAQKSIPVPVSKKMPRVLATTIRRHSGRLSLNGNSKKRRSINKNNRSKAVNNCSSKVPDIIIDEASMEDGVVNIDENEYDSFQKRISPDSRSSIQIESSSALKSSAAVKKLSEAKKRRQQHKLAAIEERKRLCTLPKPSVVRTPSKPSIREYPVSPGASSSSSSSRKLTTKNLPIII